MWAAARYNTASFDQLARETDGNVAIAIKHVPISRYQSLINFVGPLGPRDNTPRDGIFAHNPQVPDSPAKELAEWSQDLA
jgi:hypothetical protein